MVVFIIEYKADRLPGSDDRVASLKPHCISKQTFIYKTKENQKKK